jgi:putative hydrolase
MSNDPFGDVPLFRELQKLLFSSSGPINLVIAEQIATALVGEAPAGPTDRAAAQDHVDAVRSAERLVAGYTRLSLTEPFTTQVLTPNEWVATTLTAWRWLLEQMATGFSSAFDQQRGLTDAQQNPDALGRVVPLMMGMQVGTLLGHLARDALGRYDLPLPRDDEGRLFLVHSNAARIAADYGFDQKELLQWLAVKDVARHLVATQHPWVEKYLRSALKDLVAATEIDMPEMERKLTELQSQGVEAMAGSGLQDALPILRTAAYQQALERVQATVAILEGYAHAASSAVAGEVISSAAKITEGMARHAASPSEGKTALGSLLGIGLDRSLQAAGVTFCAATIDLKGIGSLNRLWDAPDNLPAVAEIKDPFLWMERVLPG